MPKQVLPLTGSLYFKTTTLILWWKAVRHTWQMRLNGNMNTKNRWETYQKIPYRGGRFIIESKNNRYTVVANLGYLQRQFKNHYYLSSATNSTFLWILVFIFSPVFLCFALRSERRLTYCHEYDSRSNRYFKIQRRRRQRERKKTIGFISKIITLHVLQAYWYISLPFLHDYDVKLPNFAFYGLCKQATTKFYFCFWTWKCSLRIQLQEGSPTFDKVIG